MLGLFSLGMLFMLHNLWFMMDLGGCRLDFDSLVHVVSASASMAPLCVVASCCALAMARSFLVAAAFDLTDLGACPREVGLLWLQACWKLLQVDLFHCGRGGWVASLCSKLAGF